MRQRGGWLAALALGVYLVAVAVWVGYDRRSAREVFPPGSMLDTGDQGLSLAYGYLRARSARSGDRDRIGILRRRVEAGSVPRRAVVLRVMPGAGPLLLEEEERDKDQKDGKDSKDGKEEKGTKKKKGDKEKKRIGDRGKGGPALLTAEEEAWVRAGGRLVLALDESYGPVEVEPVQEKGPVVKVFPLWPGVSKLHPVGRLALAGPGLAAAHAVILAGMAPIVAREVVGAGEVIFLSCPEVLQNRLLGQADHLALLEALAGEGSRPVLFDERAHGFGEEAGLAAILGSWGLGPLLLLALLAAAAAFWRAAVRIGAPDRDPSDTRSDAVELVDSLADLYDRALGRGDAVRLYHESFLQTVAAETGLRGKALQERTHELLEKAGGFAPAPVDPRHDLPRDRFDQALRVLNEAFRRLQDAKHT